MDIQKHLKELIKIYPVIDFERTGIIPNPLESSTKKFEKEQEIRKELENNLRELVKKYYNHENFLLLGSVRFGYRIKYNDIEKYYYKIYALELGVLFAPKKEMTKKDRITFEINRLYYEDGNSSFPKSNDVFNSKKQEEKDIYKICSDYLAKLK